MLHIPSDINMTVHNEILLNGLVDAIHTGYLKDICEIDNGKLKLKVKLSPFPFSRTIATFDMKADQDRFFKWAKEVGLE